MKGYYTFKRSCLNWREFATAVKTTVDTGLTFEEASSACKEFNSNRTKEQEIEGTKLEFTEE